MGTDRQSESFAPAENAVYAHIAAGVYEPGAYRATFASATTSDSGSKWLDCTNCIYRDYLEIDSRNFFRTDEPNPLLTSFNSFLRDLPPYADVVESMKAAHQMIGLQEAETTALQARMVMNPDLGQLRTHSQPEYEQSANRLDPKLINTLLSVSELVYSGRKDDAQMAKNELLQSAGGDEKLTAALNAYFKKLDDVGAGKPTLVKGVTAAYDEIRTSHATSEYMWDALHTSELYKRWKQLNGNQ